MKTAVIYCQVSTDNQEREGTSLETQLLACLKYCQDKGYDVAFHFSEAYSGLSLERPKLKELRDLVRDDKVDIVVVYCLDWLSRDPTHGVIITQELEKHHVKLEAVIEDVDNSELGKLISYVRGFASKLEAEKIKERTTRGKAFLVDKGILPSGTGKGLYGFLWDKEKKKRVPIEYEVKIVEKIFEMLDSGMSRHMVAKSLNEQGIPTKNSGKLHPLTIQRLATNPAYIGITYYYQTKGSHKTTLIKQDKDKWKILTDVTPAVIGHDLFERVQMRLKQQKEARHNMDTRHYLLRGYVYCGDCGSPLIGSCLNRKYLRYICRGTYATSARKAICKASYIKAEMLENLVWDKVKTILSNPGLVLAELKKQLDSVKSQGDNSSIDQEIKTLEREVKDYPNQEKRLINLLKTDQFTQDYILDELGRMKTARDKNLKRLQQLKQTKIQLANIQNAEANLGAFYDAIKEHLEQCTNEHKRLAFEALSLKVKATKTMVEITGVIPVDITTTPSSDPLLTTEQTSA